MVLIFTRFACSLAFAGMAVTSGLSAAHADPLSSGWALDAGASSVTFEAAEVSEGSTPLGFRAYRGVIDRSGAAVVKVRLASLDTQDDMRDVRLRYLFFKTFEFPDATIRTEIPRDFLFELEKKREAKVSLPFSLDLHGVKQGLSTDVVASLTDDNAVSVRSVKPVMVRADDFGLMDGLSRLEDAYYSTIQPAFPVSFNFVFRPYETDLPSLVASAPITPEMCENRLSDAVGSGQVTFQKGSHEVADSSRPVLEKVVGVVGLCEGLTITVEGHTDSVGRESANQTLSERRADSVVQYLIKLGAPETRVTARGMGESAPIAPNDTPANRAKNRRIEFHADHNG